MAYINSTNNYADSRIIVGPVGQAGYQTIASAITASSSGSVIFILPGTYTENLTLKDNVNFVAFTASGEYGYRDVTIVGKIIDNGVAVSCALNNIALQTNSDYCLSLTAASAVQLVDCDINATNNAALNITNANGNIYLYQCTGNVNTTGISLWSMTNGFMWIHESQLTNSGNSVTYPTFSGGRITMYGSQVAFPIGCTSTANYMLQNCILDTSASNTTSIKLAGSGTSTVSFCTVSSGSASAIIVGTGTTLAGGYLELNSGNANQISNT